MNKVRMGIIGIGNMGSAHAKSIAEGKVQGLELTAVCDIAPEKLEWARENVPDAEQFEDYNALLESGLVDAVLIATPHYIHPDIAVGAFQNGLHVLTEKPAGVYTKQVEEMNRAALKAGTVFGIMYNQRTNPLYQKARELMKTGRLGEPKRMVWIITNWYRTQAYYDSGTWRATWAGEGGGVLINQCPHNLDLWQWIFGMPKRVRAFCKYGHWHDIEVEDEVTAYAEYENGSSAVFITTTGETPGTNRLEITGDRGKLVLEEGTLRFWELEEPERQICFTSKEGFATPSTTEKDLEIEGVEGGHNAILQNFTNAVLKGEALLAPGEEGINGLTVSNAIHLSDWTDDWVELPIDAALYEERLKERAKDSRVKAPVVSKIENLLGTYNDRWSVK